MTREEHDARIVEELNVLLSWLREKADRDTGLALVVAAQAPYGQQAHRFNMLKAMRLISFHRAGWQVLNFDREVTREDLLRLRALRTKPREDVS